MQYEPHVSASPWQPTPVKATRKRYKIEVDYYRLARLVILASLIGFWVIVFKVIF